MDPLVVVVDDDPAIRRLICRVLRQADYRVREAEDGMLALTEVAIERPALVLTDLRMPGMTGADLAGQLTRRPDPIPCIIMSADHTDTRPQGIPFLPKPFSVAFLLAVVAATCAARHHA